MTKEKNAKNEPSRPKRPSLPQSGMRLKPSHIQEIEIPAGNNAFTLQLKNQKFVSVARNNQEIMRDDSGNESLNFQLPPGKYTIITDGDVEDVTFMQAERPLLSGLPGSVGKSRMDKLLEVNAAVITGASRVGMEPDDRPGQSDIPKRVTLSRLLRRNRQPIPEDNIPDLVDKIIADGKVPDDIDLPEDILNRIAQDGRLIQEQPTASDQPVLADTSELPPQLTITIEPDDRHPLDGMLVAPSNAPVTINLQKVNAVGEPMKRSQDNDTFYVRTTMGRLSLVGDGHVPKGKLKNGKASFKLELDVKPRDIGNALVTVKIMSEALPWTEVQIQFYDPSRG